MSKENRNSQAGQTLIETMVAIFMLVMGVTAATGLAIYAFNSSSNITKQIVGIGLAREGIEAFRSMRDTNWLKISSMDTTCYNYETGASDASCYKNWLRPPGAPAPDKGYDISEPNGGKSYRLTTDSSAGSEYWKLKTDNNNWGLDFDTNVTGVGFSGFYYVSNINSGAANGTSDYYRKISVTEDATAPFDHNEFHKLKVQSQVWWTDKKCPRVADFASSPVSCRVELTTFLTNWKNY